MPMNETSTFFSIIGQALRLNPDVYAAIQTAPHGLAIALAVVLLAGLSEAAGQSLVLFLNHVRPTRFALALLLSTFSHIAGYAIWTLTIWLAAGLLFGVHTPLLGLASAVGLAYAPQIFSFFCLTPFLGNAFGVLLSLWSMLAVILAIRVGFGLETVQAVLLAGLGWLLLQVLRRTIGRPVIRLQQWMATRAAGVSLVVRPHDVSRLRRQAAYTRRVPLANWRPRPRRKVAGPDQASHGGQSHVQHTP
jgi:hypothetical protein